MLTGRWLLRLELGGRYVSIGEGIDAHDILLLLLLVLHDRGSGIGSRMSPGSRSLQRSGAVCGSGTIGVWHILGSICWQISSGRSAAATSQWLGHNSRGIHVHVLDEAAIYCGSFQAATIVAIIENITVRNDLLQAIGQAAIVGAVLVQADGTIGAKVAAIGVIAMDVAIGVAYALATAAAAHFANHGGTFFA